MDKKNTPRIKNIKVTDEEIIAYLADGRTISVPLAWSWRLSEATVQQRLNYELIGDGLGVHWPDIDEDISAEGMLYGIPAKPQQRKRIYEFNVFRDKMDNEGKK